MARSIQLPLGFLDSRLSCVDLFNRFDLDRAYRVR